DTYILLILYILYFFFSSRRRHTRFDCDWSSDVCSSDLEYPITALSLAINSTVPNHTYKTAGIKINASNYVLSGCTPISNGYCLRSEERRVGKECRYWWSREH